MIYFILFNLTSLNLNTMATPFSPFVGRRAPKPLLKRRQSELPSDLIDWEAPTIPELEKQRIVYEDYIKEMEEDHQIETMLNEEIFQIAHDAIVDEYRSKLQKTTEELKESTATNKILKDDNATEKSRVHLLLGQIKMHEDNSKANEDNIREFEERIAELETEITNNKNLIADLEQQKENLSTQNTDLKNEVEDLNFKNNELNCELNQKLETFVDRKSEADLKKELHNVKKQLLYYKKLAKGSAN